MSKANDIVVDNKAWFSTTTAAEYLGLKPMTLHNYRHHLAGPECERRGVRCYYARAALDEWNAERLGKINKRKAGKAAREAKQAKAAAKRAAKAKAEGASAAA